jgi:hypothetical protein
MSVYAVSAKSPLQQLTFPPAAKSRQGQRQFASQTPGATAVESVDLRYLVAFVRRRIASDHGRSGRHSETLKNFFGAVSGLPAGPGSNLVLVIDVPSRAMNIVE